MGKKINNSRTYPKKSCCAFLFFSQERRKTLAKEKPNLKGKDLLSEIGKEWRALPTERKKIYEEMNLQDKKRYYQEKSEYLVIKGLTASPNK